MAPKGGNAGNGGGCAAIVGLMVLVLTLAWPLFAFHRHWTTTRLINCATDYSDAGTANGCTYDYTTGNYTGTGVVTTAHSAISATGWITEVVWIGVLDPGLPRNNKTVASLAAGHLVRSSTLDTSGKIILARAQQAITDVLTSKSMPTINSHVPLQSRP